MPAAAARPDGELHPNLARLAATRAHLLQYRNTPTVAGSEPPPFGDPVALTARDDTGTLWAIDPGSSQWMRFNETDDRWEPGEPPRFGAPSLTPHDVTDRAGGGRKAPYRADYDLNWYPQPAKPVETAPHRRVFTAVGGFIVGIGVPALVWVMWEWFTR